MMEHKHWLPALSIAPGTYGRSILSWISRTVNSEGKDEYWTSVTEWWRQKTVTSAVSQQWCQWTIMSAHGGGSKWRCQCIVNTELGWTILWPALENTGSTERRLLLRGDRAEEWVPVTSQGHNSVLCGNLMVPLWEDQKFQVFSTLEIHGSICMLCPSSSETPPWTLMDKCMFPGLLFSVPTADHRNRHGGNKDSDLKYYIGFIKKYLAMIILMGTMLSG